MSERQQKAVGVAGIVGLVAVLGLVLGVVIGSGGLIVFSVLGGIVAIGIFSFATPNRCPHCGHVAKGKPIYRYPVCERCGRDRSVKA